jgi:hypothetical protein
MADHLHKQIRTAVETKLNGLATSGSRVYANRVKVMTAANLPGLRIALAAEEATAITVHQPLQMERAPSLVVECCAKGNDTLDDTLDQMSKEVEVALATGITVAGVVLYPVYRGMELSLEQGELVIGFKTLRFDLSYTALNTTPDQLTST